MGVDDDVVARDEDRRVAFESKSDTPTELPNLQINGRNYRVPAYAGSAFGSIHSAKVGRQQANSLLAQSFRGGASLVSRCRSNN
jgi:hypothetical protein